MAGPGSPRQAWGPTPGSPRRLGLSAHSRLRPDPIVSLKKLLFPGQEVLRASCSVLTTPRRDPRCPTTPTTQAADLAVCP